MKAAPPLAPCEARNTTPLMNAGIGQKGGIYCKVDENISVASLVLMCYTQDISHRKY